MGYWEALGKSDEWYTPKRVFDAMGVRFDLDPANAAPDGRHVPADRLLAAYGLETAWRGFVWLNPPFGGRNSIRPWLQKLCEHGNGICLTPDRTSAPWWQEAAAQSDDILFIAGKLKFERTDGSVGQSPSNGISLMAFGQQAVAALRRASDADLGFLASSVTGQAKRLAA